MSTAAGDSPCRSTMPPSATAQPGIIRAEFERDRDAGVEMHAGERPFDRIRRRRNPIAMRADRAGRDQHQAVGAIVELVQNFRVAGVRVGMVDALHHLPARAGRRGRQSAPRPPRADRAARWSGRRRSCFAMSRTARPSARRRPACATARRSPAEIRRQAAGRRRRESWPDCATLDGGRSIFFAPLQSAINATAAAAVRSRSRRSSPARP